MHALQETLTPPGGRDCCGEQGEAKWRCAHTCTLTRARTHTTTPMHADAHTHVDKHTHTHTHSHVRTHAHTLRRMVGSAEPAQGKPTFARSVLPHPGGPYLSQPASQSTSLLVAAHIVGTGNRSVQRTAGAVLRSRAACCTPTSARLLGIAWHCMAWHGMAYNEIWKA